MNVRLAALDDTPSLRFLRQERAVLLQQSDARLKAPTLDFATLLLQASCKVLVAEHNSSVVGYIVGFKESSPAGLMLPGIGYISELTLDAHQYHGGVGRHLIGALREQMPDLQQFIIHVPRYHAVEQAFWRALGAKEDPHPLFGHSPSLVWMIL